MRQLFGLGLASGSHYFFAFKVNEDELELVWDTTSSTWVPFVGADYADYQIDADEASPGRFFAEMPSGTSRYEMRRVFGTLETDRRAYAEDFEAIRIALGMADGDLDEQLDSLSGGGAGTGARTITITVLTPEDEGLENATVRLTQGSSVRRGLTDEDGVVTFGVDDATWSLAITAAGFSFVPDTIVVDVDHLAFERTMTADTLPVPSDLANALVLFTIDSEPLAGQRIEYRMMTPPPLVSGRAFSKMNQTSEASSSLGAIAVECHRGAEYEFRYKVGGWVTFLVPVAGEDEPDTYTIESLMSGQSPALG